MSDPDDGAIGRDPQPVRIVVKLHDNVSREEFQTLLRNSIPDLDLGPLFHSVGRNDLETLARTAETRDPTYEPPRFDQFVRIDIDAQRDIQAILGDLRARAEVAVAYVEPAPEPPAAGDRWESNQEHLDPVTEIPKGIDAEFAWNYPGGKGAGIGFIDIEFDWKLDHEDLPGGIPILGGNRTGHVVHIVHGTKTLGTVCAQEQNDTLTDGVVGIAPECNVVGVLAEDPHGIADAVVKAAIQLQIGDVLLIEAHFPTAELGLAFGASHVPVEASYAVYEAIRLATALGIVVVEPTGNDTSLVGGNVTLGASGSDLDDLQVQDSDGQWVYGFRRSVRDSGAILVAAADSHDQERLGFSNYGNRVDCFAWGNGVHTTTTNAAGTSDSYTLVDPPAFSGTSAASAIVAGAALIVQGVAAAEPSVGRRFAPLELRAMLADPLLGTPSPSSEPIGVMPDLGEILRSTRLVSAPDLYIRDSISDNGEPPSASIAASPDIIVHEGALTAAQASALYGAGTENDDELGVSTLVAGTSHRVLVRVWNRGGKDAANVNVTVWQTGLGTLPLPAAWTHVGDVVVPSVPAGDVMTLAPPIPWTPSEGYHCLVAVASHDEDPLPKAYVESLDTNLASWADVVARRNNLAHRNIIVAEMEEVFDLPDKRLKWPFQVPEPHDFRGKWLLQIHANLSGDSEIYCGMGAPGPTPGGWGEGPRTLFGKLQKSVAGEAWRIKCRSRGVTTIGPSGKYARKVWKLWLDLRVPPASRDRDAEISVRQVHDGVEYGRVTWRLKGRG